MNQVFPSDNHPPSGRGLVRAVMRDIQWPVIGILAVLAVVTAVASYKAMNPDWELTRVMYVTAQLAMLNADDNAIHLDGPMWAQYGIAFSRVAALIVLFYTLARGMGVVFREQWDRVRVLTSFKNHVIVCGGGEPATSLATRFWQEGHPVIRIATDHDELEVWRRGGHRRVVIPEDPSAPGVVERVGLSRAYLVLCAGTDDSLNLATAAAVRDSRTRGCRVPVRVHISEQSILNVLREAELLDPHLRGDHIEYFNMYETAAMAVLTAHPPVRMDLEAADRMRAPHILIVGCGRLGENIASVITRWWWGCFGECGRMTLTIVDRAARERHAHLLGLYPWVEDFAEVRFLELAVNSDEFIRGRFVDGDYAGIYVCFDSDEHSLFAARLLRSLPALKATPIVFHQKHRLPLPLAPSDNLIPFATLDAASEPSMVINGLVELQARAIHLSYVMNQLRKGDHPSRNSSLTTWENLARDLQASNFAQARDIDRKLALVGCVRRPLTRWYHEPFQFTPEEGAVLARTEHDRWVQEKAERGWRHGARKDADAKSHPDMVPWEKLPEDRRLLDVEMVNELPATLATAGWRIERLNPVAGPK